MPVIAAKKAGTCTAARCGGRIRKGELCWFTAATGTRHLEFACREAPSGTRPNRRAAPCARCHRRVPPGEGHLQVTEKGTRKVYSVTCAPACPGPPRS